MQTMLAYVHDLDPFLVRFSDTLGVRWYGLAYLLGFAIGYMLLRYLARRKLYPVPADRLADFVTYTAIVGVLLGGRLGYVIFYQIPNAGWDYFWRDPMMALRVWEGGMASHGGIIGVALFSLFYAWRHRVAWPAVLDGLAIVAPVGLFCGRVANFINGELYGRIVPPGSEHGVIFPGELMQDPHLAFEVVERIYENPELAASLTAQNGGEPPLYNTGWIIERVRDTPQVKEIVEQVMSEHARYPSQLYEAATEGLALFAVLWVLRLVCPRMWNGMFCGIFALLYAAGRIVCEEFREPDSPLSFGMTRGQFLSAFLVLIGVAFIVYAPKTRKSVQECVFYDGGTGQKGEGKDDKKGKASKADKKDQAK